MFRMTERRRRPFVIAAVVMLGALAVVAAFVLAPEQRAVLPSPTPSAANASATASPVAAATSAPPTARGTHENTILGYRITLPEGYRRASAQLITAPVDALGSDFYTTTTEREEREACLQDAGHLPTLPALPNVRVAASRNPRGISAQEWATTPQGPGGYVLSTHQKVEPFSIGGREAVRLVQDNATAVTTAFVVRGGERMYEISGTQSSSQLPRTWLDEIAKTFVVIAPQPFPSATPTVAPQAGARQAAAALVSAFAARDASAVARVMPECWISVVYAIDGTVPGQGGLNRSVALFTQLLRERFAAGDLTVTVDPTLQVATDRGREDFFLRSEWREPDRAIRIDLVLGERDGRWHWISAVHHYTAADRPCIPYRSPWSSSRTGSC